MAAGHASAHPLFKIIAGIINTNDFQLDELKNLHHFTNTFYKTSKIRSILRIKHETI